MTIGEMIKEFRLEKGIKQTELAKEVGITKEWLCAIETGKKQISVKLAYKIVNYLPLTPEEKGRFVALIKYPERKKTLEQIANMELRDQLEAKEQMIKNLKEKLEIALSTLVIIKNKEPNTWQSIQAEQAIMKMDRINDRR